MAMDDHEMGMSMSMTFSSLGTYTVTILWDFWDVRTRWQYALSCLAVVVLCMLYHCVRRAEMRMLREMTAVKVLSQNGLLLTEEAGLLQSPGVSVQRPQALRKHRAQFALLSACGYGLALLLMLIAMTYNSGLFIVLVVGWGAGTYTFHDAAI